MVVALLLRCRPKPPSSLRRQRGLLGNLLGLETSSPLCGQRWTSTSSTTTTRTSTTSSTTTRTTDVLIVGGGPSGLLMANLLNRYSSNNNNNSGSDGGEGVSYILLDAQQADFRHPQAHFLNTRSMEILRHALPNVYAQVREAMPPVTEWNHFQFGPTMTTTTTNDDNNNNNNNTTTNDNSTVMARVRHPVDRPLRAGEDANGTLVVPIVENDEVVEASKNATHDDDDSTIMELSDCSVGHLAQHTFCKILYDEATKNNKKTEDNDDNDDQHHQLQYGTRMENCRYDEETSEWIVSTDRGYDIRASTVIAADGAKSDLRHNLLNVPMLGQSEIQHLINVHFTVDEDKNDNDNNDTTTIPPAMLYTIFSQKVLAMVVRHSRGEYVMQIPYFPPYQTLEEDFTQHKVQEMIAAALGTPTMEFQIRSIRPWTMGSLVAQDYYHAKGVFLVGDAAHVFPPAGGFGMNTGLQDVFSLAWQLAILRRPRDEDDDDNNQKKQDNKRMTTMAAIGQRYQSERQPVARQNAALSVRNYQRVLKVMEACYLHHQHPTALIAGLNASISTFMIPLEVRRRTFRSLLETALWPLGQLQTSPAGVYARHVTRNLQKLLQSGQGLPLLFPNHEVAFRYYDDNDNDDAPVSTEDRDDFSTDTVANEAPKLLAKGALFPHMTVTLLLSDQDAEEFPNLCHLGDGRITTRDLAAQVLGRAESSPAVPFCLLYIKNKNTRDSELNITALCEEVSNETGVHFQAASLLVCDEKQQDDDSETSSSHDGKVLSLVVDKAKWDSLDLCDFNQSDSLLVAIRPDGHVASVVGVPNDSTLALRVLTQDIRSCLSIV
jgi:2-polyprenyl-6-methoxyphenol hydroxylase-like FAD-dependent oxidoreductase